VVHKQDTDIVMEVGKQKSYTKARQLSGHSLGAETLIKLCLEINFSFPG